MMLQKILCGYTTPISKFKSNPSAALAEAQGDAIAVSSNNQIQFYAVPAWQFEEMTVFYEFAQRGTTLEMYPAQFNPANLNINKVSTQMADILKQSAKGEFEV